MKENREELKTLLFNTLTSLAAEKGLPDNTLSPEDVIVEIPPKPELGDFGFPMFPYARIFRISPVQIAEAAAEALKKSGNGPFSFETAGPYINVRIDKNGYFRQVLQRVSVEAEKYGKSDYLKDVKITVEFSAPNTNKPLHLGHLRNDALGESLSRILEEAGGTVRKVNLINDRGIHICKSMLAYMKFGEGKTPESEGRKSDHFVGDYYVAYNTWEKEHPEAEDESRELLKKWESGDPETVELWKKMNSWAIEGITETYRKTDISFDQIYLESETYTLGKDEVLRGLEKGIFSKDETGTVWASLEDIGLDKKVLIRGDGTTLYMTQDVGTAILRYRDWPFDRMVYVVGSEQQYHFQVLFHILGLLGHPWAENMYHLSYGMVNLLEGKMKSREGTVVDADDLLDTLSSLALKEIEEKGREDDVDDPEKTAFSIALGALHYYLLQTNPAKDMIFHPEKSIAFNGATGPYLQYTCARIMSMMRKYRETRGDLDYSGLDVSLLTVPEEWEIIKLVGNYPQIVEKAAEEMNPSIVAVYLYDTAKQFSQYYHDNPILRNDNPALVDARMALSWSVLQVIRNGLHLINVPFLDSM